MLQTLFREGGRVLANALAKTVSDIVLRNRMSRMEAEKILMCPASGEELRSVFSRMHSANSSENRGSLYLQSRILAAYSVLAESLH